jgi:hypothetical protein
VTTLDGSRGGSVPPRPPVGKPQQWFVLRPWIFDVTLVGVLGRTSRRSGLGGSGSSGCLSADDLFDLRIGENAPQSLVDLFTVHA